MIVIFPLRQNPLCSTTLFLCLPIVFQKGTNPFLVKKVVEYSNSTTNVNKYFRDFGSKYITFILKILCEPTF